MQPAEAPEPQPDLQGGPAVTTDSTTTSWSLRREIRSVVDGTDLASPVEIAAKVAENIPINLLRETLEQVLPDFVRVELSRIRMSYAQPPTASQPNRSSKVAAIREAAPMWRDALRQRLSVGDGQWLLLGDCSIKHLRFAADRRRWHAARNVSAAALYESLAAACETHGARRVSELPESVLSATFDREVAA